MPILLLDSLMNPFPSLCSCQSDMCRELAVSFTFCKKFFIESVHASYIQEASLGRNEPCWHVVVVQLNDHHSFLVYVEALVALIKQIRVSAADFHMLFV